MSTLDLLLTNVYCPVQYDKLEEISLDKRLSYKKSLQEFKRYATTEYSNDLANILLGEFVGRKLDWNDRLKFFYMRYNSLTSLTESQEVSYLINILNKNKYVNKKYKKQLKQVKKKLKPGLIKRILFNLLHPRYDHLPDG
ncbi:MAG: hypothetical protein ABIF40_04865 [archaeon]